MSARPNTATWLWRLRPAFRLDEPSDGVGRLSGPAGWELPVRDPASLTLLRQLADGIAEADILASDAAAETLVLLRRLIDRQIVEAVLVTGHGDAAIIETCGSGYDLPSGMKLPASIRLDRFAYLRGDDRGLTLEHPEAACRVVLLRPELAAFAARIASGSVQTADIHDPVERALAAILAASGYLAPPAEPASRQTWEFHDLLFHRASRAYGDGRVRGGSYRFRGKIDAPPAFRPPHQGETIALPEAMPNPLSTPLAALMERRRSVRAYSAQPVSITSISEVLHRIARPRSGILRGETGQDCYLRPVPSAGSIQTIELYLAVRDGQALAPGFYHYRGAEHVLTRIEGAEAPATDMLRQCAGALRLQDPPSILAVLAARLPKLAWKYEGIGYHLALLDAGVLIQSLYLVTTDLGLAGCAAGLGDNAAFQRAIGGNGLDEVNIAEFAFGNPACAQSEAADSCNL